MTDAALVMRHSIHQTSARNKNQYHNANHGEAHFVSHYDYKMYAIVHSQAAQCSQILHDAGFEIVIKDAPVQPKEIQGEFCENKFTRNGAVVMMNSSNSMPKRYPNP
jgi:hypothetical protein